MSKIKPAQLKKDASRNWYQFHVFEKLNVTAAFSSRRFHMNFHEQWKESVVVAHRRHFCHLVGVPFERVVCLEQVHGGNIVRVNKKDAGRGSRSSSDAIRASDGALTSSNEVVLSVRTADCAPVFFVDPTHSAIGIAHVGWRGASERLGSKMVQAMRGQFLTRPSDLVVAIGPMIHACCYEVSSDFKDVFGSFVTKRTNRFFFNLTRWVIDDLVAEGVERRHVYDSGLCTACLNDQFSSYRREGDRAPQMLSILKLN